MKKIVKFAFILILIGIVFVGFVWVYYGRSFRNITSVNGDFFL